MMNRLRIGVVVGITVVATAFAVGCSGSGDSRPAVSDLNQGLTMFRTDTHIAGAFVKGTRAVYFETRRGPEKIDVYQRIDTAASPYEMDVRVLDENGRLVYVQTGGDLLVDTAWHKDMEREESLPRVDPLQRAETFELLKEAMDAIEKFSAPAALAHEHRAILDARLSIRDTMMPIAVKQSLAETGYSPGTNSIELHKMSIYGGIAEHSATWSNISGTVRVSCNHGTCASSMGYVCTGSGGGGTDYHEYSTINGSVNSPACTTSYNWNSTGGGHNCHDDSVRQIWGVQYGSQGSGTSGVCNNGASHWYGPSSCSIGSW